MPAIIKYIESSDDLETVFKDSFSRPNIVLKHSRTCGISAHIMHQVVDGLDHPVNVIVVQTHRDLSDNVADRTGHRHHSPQLFVLSNGVAVYHATHYGIDCVAVKAKMYDTVADLAGEAAI